MGGLVAVAHERVIEIGGMPILVRTESLEFARMLEDRYGEFVIPDAPHPHLELEIELVNDPELGNPE